MLEILLLGVGCLNVKVIKFFSSTSKNSINFTTLRMAAETKQKVIDYMISENRTDTAVNKM